nr:hypothetical protein [Tanacetum cinerariifolium]
MDHVKGDINQRTLRSQLQNNFFAFISTLKPKSLEEAIKDELKIVTTARRKEMPLPEVCTAIEEKKKKLPEVIEFGDSYKVPTNTDLDDTTTKRDAEQSRRTVTFRTEDMQKKKNDVKVRTTLLLSLPDEHQSRFSKYKTAKELWAAILKTFGGNEATKKRKKNILKQQYGNFKAEGTETLEQTFNRLQVIVSQLQFMDVEVEKDDLNQKFLTSLAPEWLMHTIDMAFISSSKNSSNEDGNTVCVTTASTAFPTGSVNVAIISQDTASAYIASQSNGSHIKFEDINQIDEDDKEDIDIKWNMALLSIRTDKFWKRTRKKISIQGSDVAGFNKSKVECFNCHMMGHFARECRAPISQERGRKESYKQGSKAKEKSSKALMAIDGVGWDWSYMANEEDHALVADGEATTEFALMANIENKVFDNSLCLNECKKNTDSLNNKIKDLKSELYEANNFIYHYKLAVAQLEGRLTEYKEREVKYIEKIRILEMYRASNLKSIKILTKELEEVKLEKDGLDGKLAGLLKASKNLDHLIESQRFDQVKEGVGYNAVPPAAADLYLSPKKDLSWAGLPEFVDDTVTDYSRPSPTVVSTSAEGQNKDSSTFEDVASPNPPKPFVKSAGHRPHGPSMNPRRPTMNSVRPYKSFFIQSPSYETRPLIKSSAVKTPY